MGNSALILTFLLGPLHVNVNPLVVKRGVSKKINVVLVYLQPLRGSEYLAQVGSKLIIAVNNQFSHIEIILYVYQ